jgi:hypothetical protein
MTQRKDTRKENGLGTAHMVRKTDLHGQRCQINRNKMGRKVQHFTNVFLFPYSSYLHIRLTIRRLTWLWSLYLGIILLEPGHGLGEIGADDVILGVLGMGEGDLPLSAHVTLVLFHLPVRHPQFHPDALAFGR